jgi:serine/threonine protein kinase
MSQPGSPNGSLADLFADQQQRWQGGERPLVESYFLLWPSLKEDAAAVQGLIAREVALRRQLGEAPELAEYLGRFPAHAALLPDLFPAEVSTQPMPPSEPPRRVRKAPQIPGYDEWEFLDDGGQGEVWKARHHALRRVIALKVMRAAHPDEEQQTLARFQREGRLVARLDHPNIVRLHDYAEYQGRLYFTMEYLEGGNLKERFGREGPQDPVRAARLLAELARALQHAHDNGVVHRDLKPSNILFSHDGIAKVADFGLAKPLEGDVTELTRTRAVLGTASYMAPEQAAGKSRQVCPATDVYALGAILYEALTGRPPFAGESWLDTLDLVRFHPVVPPRRHRPDLPPSLERVCLRCLEKEAARRYPSARDLAGDLDHFVAGKLDPAETPAPGDDALQKTWPPVSSPWSVGPEPDAAPPPAAAPGQIVIPGYEILGILGRGGMGVVYMARQLSLNRIVALKTILGVGSGANRWRRLRQEAEFVASLNHPHIVQIYDLGEHADLVFIAMEHIPGGTLAIALEQGLPDPVQAAELVEPLAQALGFVHHKGLIHRDVKPANVLLLPPDRPVTAPDGKVRARDRYGIPKLTDFGLARRHGRPDSADGSTTDFSAGDQFSTHMGEVVGTPSYMAPEQAMGRPEDTGPASDVWALGATLYELLTGRPPFRGASVMETLQQILAGEPAPLRQRQPRVPQALAAVCMRCLRKDPRQRYPTGRELADDLRTFLDGRRPAAMAGGFWSRVFSWRPGG